MYPNYDPGQESTQPLPSGPPLSQGDTRAERRKRNGRFLLFAVSAVIVLCCAGGVVSLFGADSAKDGFNAATGSSVAPAVAVTTAPAKAPAPKYVDPKPADFKLELKVIRKRCFGSAGCNVTFQISDVIYSGGKMDPDKTYTVTYEVRGLEDSIIDSFTLRGDGQYDGQRPVNGQTSSSKFKLTSSVTSVD